MTAKSFVVEIHDHEGEFEQTWVFGPYTERQANARARRLMVKQRKENRVWAKARGEKFLDRYPLTCRVVQLRTLEEAEEL